MTLIHDLDTTPEFGPLVETRAGLAIPTSLMAIMLGELNNEASCITMLATPSETLTPVGQIIENLRVRGAFDMEDRRRFNVNNILNQLPPTWITRISEPVSPSKARATAWAQKDPGVFGVYVSAFAGALLGYSLDRNMPLRKIIGEKRLSKGQSVNAVESRLGVLTSALFLAGEDGKSTFKKDKLYEIGEQYDIPHPVTYRHMRKLMAEKELEDAPRGKRRIRFTTHPDGTSAAKNALELLRIVGEFSIGSDEAATRGLDRGDKIMNNPVVLPLLVRRSFASSTHTGKSTTRDKNKR